MKLSTDRMFGIAKPLLFLTLLVGMLCGIEMSARHFFQVSEDADDIVRNKLLQIAVKNKIENIRRFEAMDKDGIRIAVFGSSHAMTRIDPALFSAAAYNFAQGSQDIYYDYQLFEKYALPELPDLQVVILSVDFFSFWFDMATASPQFVHYYRQLGIPPKTEFMLDPLAEEVKAPPESTGGPSRFEKFLNRRSYFLRNRAVYFRSILAAMHQEPPATPQLEGNAKELKYREEVLREIREATADMQSGRKRKMSSSPSLVQLGRSRAELHMETNYWDETQDLIMRLYHRMIQQARARGIKVLLVTLPSRPEYYQEIAKRKYNLFKERLQELLSGYTDDPGLQYLDFTASPFFHYEDDFTDTDHVSDKGSVKLTYLLDQAIQDLWGLNEDF